jgi:hypothetical protein
MLPNQLGPFEEEDRHGCRKHTARAGGWLEDGSRELRVKVGDDGAARLADLAAAGRTTVFGAEERLNPWTTTWGYP